MNWWFRALIALSALMGASPALAQGQPANPGYLIVFGKTTDRAKIGQYSASLPPIYVANGGYYLAIGGAGRGVNWIEGPLGDRSLIFAKFPSRAAVDGFWWGESYRTTIRKRDNAGTFTVFGFEGTGPLAYEGRDAAYLVVMTASGDAEDQKRRSVRAAELLVAGVMQSGGAMVADLTTGQFTAMEGDSFFDHIQVAAWPNKAAREAYLQSSRASAAKRMRSRIGISLVATADGVPRNQPPPAATPPVALPQH
jgi:uncharacterized protein (DUF1330 family)